MASWTQVVPCECCDGTIILSNDNRAGPLKYQRPSFAIQDGHNTVVVHRWHTPRKFN